MSDLTSQSIFSDNVAKMIINMGEKRSLESSKLFTSQLDNLMLHEGLVQNKGFSTENSYSL